MISSLFRPPNTATAVVSPGFAHSACQYVPGARPDVAAGYKATCTCDSTAVDVTVIRPAADGVVVTFTAGGTDTSACDTRATYSHVNPVIGNGTVPPGAVVVNVNTHDTADPAFIRSVHG
jgi:hypothetical protein